MTKNFNTCTVMMISFGANSADQDQTATREEQCDLNWFADINETGRAYEK